MQLKMHSNNIRIGAPTSFPPRGGFLPFGWAAAGPTLSNVAAFDNRVQNLSEIYWYRLIKIPWCDLIVKCRWYS